MLYRKIYISTEELNDYKKSIGKIFCYPSFTSTSIIRNGYSLFNQEQNKVLVELWIQQNNSPSIICIKELSNHIFLGKDIKNLNLTNQQQSTAEDHLCIYCLVEPSEIILAPCGHKYICNKCYKSLKEKKGGSSTHQIP